MVLRHAMILFMYIGFQAAVGALQPCEEDGQCGTEGSVSLLQSKYEIVNTASGSIETSGDRASANSHINPDGKSQQYSYGPYRNPRPVIEYFKKWAEGSVANSSARILHEPKDDSQVLLQSKVLRDHVIETVDDADMDEGHEDAYRGWYDVQGVGTCNDYCRWVGGSGSGGDPTQKLVHKTSWWSCRLRGSYNPKLSAWSHSHTPHGHFNSWSLLHCEGQGAVAPPPIPAAMLYVPGTAGAGWSVSEMLIVRAKLQRMYNEGVEMTRETPSYRDLSNEPWISYPSANKVVRLGFHDCLKYKDGSGGCDGCLQWDGVEHRYSRDQLTKGLISDSSRPDGHNNGLSPTVQVLEMIYTERAFPKNTPILPRSLQQSGKSRADLWAFAAIEAVRYSMQLNNLACKNAEGDGAAFFLKNQASGLCLHTEQATAHNGGKMVWWHGCRDEKNKFVTVPASRRRGAFYLKNKASGKCVHTESDSAQNGVGIVFWDGCRDWKNVLVRVDVGGGAFYLKNQASGRCLHVEGSHARQGGRLVYWDGCSGRKNRFQTVQVDASPGLQDTLNQCHPRFGQADCAFTLPEFSFETGRKDCRSRSFTTSKKESHPSPNWSGARTVAFMQKEFGFTGRETVAIMGAHTLGRPHVTISLMRYTWKTRSGMLFNNGYYRNLAKKRDWFYDSYYTERKWKAGRSHPCKDSYSVDHRGERPRARWVAHVRGDTTVGGPTQWIQEKLVCPRGRKRGCSRFEESWKFVNGLDEMMLNSDMGLYMDFDVGSDGIPRGCKGFETFNREHWGHIRSTGGFSNYAATWTRINGQKAEPLCKPNTMSVPPGSTSLHQVVEEYANDQAKFIRDFVPALEKMLSNGYSDNELIAAPSEGMVGYSCNDFTPGTQYRFYSCREGAPVKGFTVKSGPCKTAGNCVTSPNFPSNYGNNERCTIQTPSSGTMKTISFSTESGWDWITLDGKKYQGSTGPTTKLSASKEFTWRSDSSVVRKGWQICMSTSLLEKTEQGEGTEGQTENAVDEDDSESDAKEEELDEKELAELPEEERQHALTKAEKQAEEAAEAAEAAAIARQAAADEAGEAAER